MRHTRFWALFLTLSLIVTACGDGNDVLTGDIASLSTTPGAAARPVGPTSAPLESPAEPEGPDTGVGTPDPANSGGGAAVTMTDAEVRPAVFDALNEGEIDEIFDIDAWTFDGVEGGLLTVDVLRMSGDCRQDMELVIIDPVGEVIASEWVGNGACDGFGPVELGSNGEFAIVFRGKDGRIIENATGEYAFVPSLLTEFDQAPMTFDALNEGEISQLFGSDTWTFDGVEGGLLTVDVLRMSGDCRQDMELVIVDPVGEVIASEWVGNGACDGFGPVELAGAGEYSLVFRGKDGQVIKNKTGEYAFVPSYLTEFDRAPLVFDEIINGEIDQLFGSDRYSFDAVAGQQLTIDVVTIDHDCRQALDLRVRDPLGESTQIEWIGNGGCKGHGPVEIESSGEHLLIFDGGDGAVISDTTGEYSFVASWLQELDEAPAAFGQLNTGEITELFGSDYWLFDGVTGQQLSIEVVSIGEACRQDLHLWLVDPFEEWTKIDWIGNGGCKAYGPFELGRDGEHALVFAGGAGGTIDNATGEYSFIPALTG